MSNNLLVNPVVITATMGSSFKASLPAVNVGVYLRVEKIIWESPATIGDQLVIEDPQGNVLFPATCEVAGQSQIFDWVANPKIWSDFQVTTLGSGTVYIYLR